MGSTHHHFYSVELSSTPYYHLLSFKTAELTALCQTCNLHCIVSIYVRCARIQSESCITWGSQQIHWPISSHVCLQNVLICVHACSDLIQDLWEWSIILLSHVPFHLRTSPDVKPDAPMSVQASELKQANIHSLERTGTSRPLLSRSSHQKGHHCQNSPRVNCELTSVSGKKLYWLNQLWLCALLATTASNHTRLMHSVAWSWCYLYLHPEFWTR